MNYNKMKPDIEMSDGDTKPAKQISGTPIKKKDNLINRFSKLFFGDTIGNVGKYVFEEVFIPGLKDVTYNIIDSTSRQMLFGDDSMPNRTGYSTNTFNAGKTTSPSTYTSINLNTSRKSLVHFVEVGLASKVDAMVVYDELQESIAKYGHATLMKYYWVTKQPYDTTDENFGWTSLHGCRPTNTRNGWYLKLPNPIQL